MQSEESKKEGGWESPEEGKRTYNGLISKHKDQMIQDYNRRGHGGCEGKKAFFKYKLLG